MNTTLFNNNIDFIQGLPVSGSVVVPVVVSVVAVVIIIAIIISVIINVIIITPPGTV